MNSTDKRNYWIPTVPDWAPSLDGEYVVSISNPIRILGDEGIEHLNPGKYILTYENSICVNKELL